MTKEQLKDDTLKFVRYLEANGEHVTMAVVETDSGTVACGYNEVITDTLVRVLADRFGYRLEAKK